MDELTPRLQRIRMHLMRYNYKVIHVPGKHLVLADSLSRNPLATTNIVDKNDFSDKTESYVKFVIGNLPATRTMLEKIKVEQESDYICSKLRDYSLKKIAGQNSAR